MSSPTETAKSSLTTTKYITVKTLDGVSVEVTHSDAGFPPGSASGGLALNTTAVWIRPAGGDWIKSSQRSAMVTCDIVKHANAAELTEKLK